MAISLDVLYIGLQLFRHTKCQFLIAIKIKQNLQTNKVPEIQKVSKYKFHGTASFSIRELLFSVRTTSLIDLSYCYLNNFAVFIYKITSDSLQICLLNICTKHLLFFK